MDRPKIYRKKFYTIDDSVMTRRRLPKWRRNLTKQSTDVTMNSGYFQRSYSNLKTLKSRE